MMNKKLLTYIAWILLMLSLLGVGFYIYTTTFVNGSFSGLNPYGLLALGGSVIAAWFVFMIGRYKSICPYN